MEGDRHEDNNASLFCLTEILILANMRRVQGVCPARSAWIGFSVNSHFIHGTGKISNQKSRYVS